MLEVIKIKNELFKNKIHQTAYNLLEHSDINVVNSRIIDDSIFSIDNTVDFYKNKNALDDYINYYNFLFTNRKKEINIVRLIREDRIKLFELCYLLDNLYNILNEAIDEYNNFNDDPLMSHLYKTARLLRYAEEIQIEIDDVLNSTMISNYYYQYR